MNEHIECKQPKYSSMKLSHFLGETETENSVFFYDFSIRVSVFVISYMNKGRRYNLIKEVESILREDLHPLIGKQ